MNRGLFLSAVELDKYIIIIIITTSIYHSLAAELYISFLLRLISLPPNLPPARRCRTRRERGARKAVMPAPRVRGFSGESTLNQLDFYRSQSESQHLVPQKHLCHF